MLTMTKHARFERNARLEYIIDTIGMGEPVCEIESRQGGQRILTNTGIIIVKDGTTLITAFIADFNQAYAIYKIANPNGKFPKKLESVIKLNHKGITAHQPRN